MIVSKINDVFGIAVPYMIITLIDLMSPKYVDYHTAKQLSDADGDINDASSQNLLSEIVEMQSTPKHSCVFSFDIQQRMPN